MKSLQNLSRFSPLECQRAGDRAKLKIEGNFDGKFTTRDKWCFGLHESERKRDTAFSVSNDGVAIMCRVNVSVLKLLGKNCFT